MFKNSKRGEGNYKKDYGSNDVYKKYKEDVIPELQVDKKLFRKICDDFNRMLIEEILLNSEEVRLPYRL